MAKPVHSMIRVFDEAKSLDFYARAFRLEVADHLKFADFALIYLRHRSLHDEHRTATTQADCKRGAQLCHVHHRCVGEL